MPAGTVEIADCPTTVYLGILKHLGRLPLLGAVLGNLLLTTAIGFAGSSLDSTIQEIVDLSKAGKISEEEAVAHLQRIIDSTKRELASHVPPKTDLISNLIARPRLQISIHSAHVSCVVTEPPPVTLIRHRDKLELRLGKRPKQEVHHFDLGDHAEAKRWGEVFDGLEALAKKMLTAAPTGSWLADKDASELFKEYRHRQRSIGGDTSIAKIEIQSDQTTMALGGIESPFYSEIDDWQRRLAKMLEEKAAPTNEK